MKRIDAHVHLFGPDPWADELARSMGHEGTLSSSAVMLTTVCSAFSFTGWLYLLKTFALI